MTKYFLAAYIQIKKNYIFRAILEIFNFTFQKGTDSDLHVPKGGHSGDFRKNIFLHTS